LFQIDQVTHAGPPSCDLWAYGTPTMTGTTAAVVRADAGDLEHSGWPQENAPDR
jgi:hypothetical protein